MLPKVPNERKSESSVNHTCQRTVVYGLSQREEHNDVEVREVESNGKEG